jgi:hypothetical protein
MTDGYNSSYFRFLKVFGKAAQRSVEQIVTATRKTLRAFLERAVIAPREEIESTQRRGLELGVEFCLELAIVLYQLGAEQMDLPHNFWVGLACWIVGLGTGLRMLWIFPPFERIRWPTKALASILIAGLFVRVMWTPVGSAYEQQYGIAAPPDIQKVLVRLMPRPQAETPHEAPPHKPQHHSGEGFMSINVATVDPAKVVDVGSPINFQVTATNIGHEAVSSVFMFSAFMAVGEMSATFPHMSDAEVLAKFHKLERIEIAKQRKVDLPPSNYVAPGQQRMNIIGSHDTLLTKAWVDSFYAKKTRLYVLSWVEWKTVDGVNASNEECGWLEPPNPPKPNPEKISWNGCDEP